MFPFSTTIEYILDLFLNPRRLLWVAVALMLLAAVFGNVLLGLAAFGCIVVANLTLCDRLDSLALPVVTYDDPPRRIDDDYLYF